MLGVDEAGVLRVLLSRTRQGGGWVYVFVALTGWGSDIELHAYMHRRNMRHAGSGWDAVLEVWQGSTLSRVARRYLGISRRRTNTIV
jgi:hypothetical protein